MYVVCMPNATHCTTLRSTSLCAGEMWSEEALPVFEERPRRSHCPRLVVLLLVFRTDELCLSTDADQDRRAHALQRGDHGVNLRDGHVEAGLASHTM